MTVEFTAVYREFPEGSMAFVGELPGADARGATLDETPENPRDAVILVLETNRALAEEVLAGRTGVRGPCRLSA